MRPLPVLGPGAAAGGAVEHAPGLVRFSNGDGPQRIAVAYLSDSSLLAMHWLVAREPV